MSAKNASAIGPVVGRDDGTASILSARAASAFAIQTRISDPRQRAFSGGMGARGIWTKRHRDQIKAAINLRDTARRL
jgi:hypothetical protein